MFEPGQSQNLMLVGSQKSNYNRQDIINNKLKPEKSDQNVSRNVPESEQDWVLMDAEEELAKEKEELKE